MLSTIARAGSILELFDADHSEWGVTDVADFLGISKASASEHLSSLSTIGLLRRTKNHRYCLGWPLLFLSLTIQSSESLLSTGPVLHRWSAKLGESVNVVILANDRVLNLTPYMSSQVGHFTPDLRARNLVVNPSHSTSAGKVLLAYEPPDRVERILGRKVLPRLTQHTLTDVDLLQDELELIRTRGFAYDFQETVDGRCCIAAPIRDSHDDVIAAVSLVTSRTTMLLESERYTKATVGIADEMTTVVRQN